jgi:hypothetical protein
MEGAALFTITESVHDRVVGRHQPQVDILRRLRVQPLPVRGRELAS